MGGLFGKLAGFVLPPWAKWVGLALSVLAVVLSIYGYGQQQYKRGESACALPYLKRANQGLAEANALIVSLQKQVKQNETAHQLRLAALDKSLTEKANHEKAKDQAVIRDLRAGIVKLQYSAKPTASEQANRGTASQVKPSPSGGDGTETSELPSTLAGDIYDLAADADQVVEQLNACQQVVIEDRRLCGVAE